MTETPDPKEPPSRARKLRLWVAKRVPRGLRGLVLGMPEWGVRLAAIMVGLFLISSTVAFLRGVTGGMEFVNLPLTDPLAAMRQLGPGAKSASQEALDAQAAEIAKIKLALLQMQSAQGARLQEDAAGRRDRAIEGLYDGGAAERDAAAKLASGDVKGAAELLENAAQAETRGAAEKWRRIGALFNGADNARAGQAYAAAFALDPKDYATSLELSRLSRIGFKTKEAVDFAAGAIALAKDPRERLTALTELGKAQIAIGALTEALDTQTKALDAAESLANANPNDAVDQRNLAIALHRVAEAEFELGRNGLGKARFERSYAMTAGLAKAQPGNIDAAVDMTYPAIRLGEIAFQQGELMEAGAWFQRALPILERAAKTYPDQIDAQRNLGVAYQKLGDTLLRANAAELALKDFKSALAIFEALQAKTPQDRQFQRDLAIARNKAGDALASAKKFREAREMYELSLPIFTALAKDPGAAPVLRRDLSVTYEKIGDAAIGQDLYAEALVWYEKSLPIAEALSRDFPDNPRFAAEAKSSSARLAELKRKVRR